MEILKIENLEKVYKTPVYQVDALRSLSFCVQKKEFIAITGPSGCGKSTLLHILGGVDQQTGGTVIIDDLQMETLDDTKLTLFRRRHIGLIYQFYNLIPMLSVEENIQLPILLDEGIVDSDYYNELITLLQLEDRLNHLPNQLSGGQQQRVAIARALMNKPSLLLADEPTGNLDQENSRRIMTMLRYANETYNQTIILVTHDIDIARMADRTIHIEDGKIVYDGTNQ
ncbi:ABC transporter ATP-binding protein [Erysipelothrix aquatica]|uniref:ABC transporter ATP-binding protein n=1 Tax=Erysipelothrix aquatica TaxID=2683714 RepID=UPI00135861C5|nr:ABC transporter ATP-binding protein [Erysipelothrix aquatica]